MKESREIIIFDTTLRDGEQAPGCSMTMGEKLKIAHALKELNVDVIEAGFAAASPGDFDAVNAIASEIDGPTICSLARCNESDIEKAYEALKVNKNRRVHVFVATSEIHLKHKLNMAKDEVLKAAYEGVKMAKSFCENVEFSPEDASRTDHGFLTEVVNAAIEAGATTINVPDTVGYTIPYEFGELFKHLISNCNDAENVIFSVHCHDDLGLSVANSLAAVESGARQIECTINGIGERAGNTSLEEVCMAIRTREEYFDFKTSIDSTKLYPTSRLVSSITGMHVPRNKAIVGDNAFAHEAGIHQDGMLKNRQTYEIMTPESVGVKQTSLVMGKHSGRHAFKDKLNSLGYPDLTDDIVSNSFAKFKVLADKKKHVYDEDIIALVDDSLIVDNKVNAINLKSLKVFAGTGEPQRAEMTLDVYGEIKQATETGDGPVDAIFKCIKKLYPHDVNLQLYQVHAVTEGTDAQATVSVKIEENGKTTVGQAADTDTLVASANAYISSLNKMIIKRDKTAPEQQQNYETQKMKGI